MNDFPSVPEWLRDSDDEFLTADERAQVDILFGCIWPADLVRGIPGAVDVQASRYVSRLLARSAETFRDIPKWRILYRTCLKSLDEYAQRQYGVSLAKLDATQADEVITGLEKQALAGVVLPAGATQYALFDMLRRHCIQGCLSDPRWGGNTDKLMWRAVGFLQPAEDIR